MWRVQLSPRFQFRESRFAQRCSGPFKLKVKINCWSVRSNCTHDLYSYLKLLYMCQLCTQWLRSLDLPKPVSCLGPLLAHTAGADSSPHPHPPLLPGRVSRQVFTDGNQRNLTEQACQSVSDAVTERQKLRVGGYLFPLVEKEMFQDLLSEQGLKPKTNRDYCQRFQCIEAVIIPLIVGTIIQPLTQLTQQHQCV